MRIHKVVNRVYEGTVYYRWVLSIPPKSVRELGWVDGQELETMVRGSSLWVQPSLREGPRRRGAEINELEEGIQRRSVARYREPIPTEPRRTASTGAPGGRGATEASPGPTGNHHRAAATREGAGPPLPGARIVKAKIPGKVGPGAPLKADRAGGSPPTPPRTPRPSSPGAPRSDGTGPFDH